MAGRPRKEIDKTAFENLCALMCTREEICGWFKVAPNTLLSWCKKTYGKNFEDAFTDFSANGRISLRRYQFQLAKKSAAMAIFLGKQYLGQRDDAGLISNGGTTVDDGFIKAVKESAGEIWKEDE